MAADRCILSHPHIHSRQRQDHVFSAESEAIDEGPADVSRTPLPGDVIQIAIGIRLGQVQRGRNELVFECQRGADDLKGPAGGKGMTKRPFE